jgi:succinate-semialdehyde dehydrogenase/glutarate-semialdehyde dehydrogenase
MTTVLAPATTDVRLLIAGETIRADARESLPLINPATGAEIGRVPIATDDDLQHALEAAARGFEQWRNVSAFDRATILRKAATLIRERSEDIARLLTLEQGKTLGEARGEIIVSAEILEWTADEARRAYGRVVPSRQTSVRQLVFREPVGPVAAFTPWNFPALTPARKLAGALAVGCSLIIKPAEETPLTALALVDALHEAGVPGDVLGVVFGKPAHISQTLIASPVIRKISFTGSTAVGKSLARLAADGMKRATLELGGHAPVIVTSHADIERAAKASVAMKYRNAGQVCISPTRFLVQESVYDAFTEIFVKRASSLRVGDGFDDTTQMASLANERRRDAIDTILGEATACGARIATGGKRIAGDGFYFEPTVVTDVPANARVINDEPFGPIAVINRFRDLPAAIAEANRLPYGLAAYAFTENAAEAHQLSNGIEAGMVGINTFNISQAELPFGGVKDSGYGSEGGTEGLDGYLVTKSVTLA